MKRILKMGIFLLLAIVLGLALSSSALSNPYPQEPPPPALIEQLQRQTEGQVRISYHAQTGKVRFIGIDPAHPIPRPAILAPQATPEEAARHFLATYGRLFGLTDQTNELTVMRTDLAHRGRSFVRFQQVYQGIPVMGGELIVQLDASKNFLSANGELLPDLAVDVVPTIDAETARQTALAKVAKDYGLSVAGLTTTEPQLWIYNPILLGGPGLRFNSLVWRMDVEPRELLPIRELVLIDAHLGAVALHFNQIDTAKNRIIYDNQNNPAYGLPGNGPVRTEGGPATGITDVDLAYDYTGHTYDFYNTYHGRDSIDNAGMNLISTVRYCDLLNPCPYANAFWNGSQMVYGQGWSAADDVVGHELTHGVTQYESGLFYYYQSGAINESFSDIWGEFVDLTNGAGTDGLGVDWQIGEDVPGVGAFRDMSNPPAYNDPGRMTSGNYWCAESDNGGVHTNSGVGNKAAYLMTDGGSFNGYTITGIGITKTAKIFYEVQTNLFTAASDYADLYDALPQACLNLIGTSGITVADCQEVQKAVAATEMNLQPTSCPATEAPVCPAGQSSNNLFFDNLENTASGNWSSAANVGSNAWYYPQTANPYGFDATYATSGVYNIWGYAQGARADYYIAMTTDVALPAGSTPYLHLNHAHGFEDSDTGAYYDGGIIQYSTNGGASWNDVNPSWFTHNGYNGTIASGWGNPLGGSQAFVDDSHGYSSSRLNLSALAAQSVRFRFRIGTDVSYDDWGWFIDDVRIYTCGAVIPPPTGHNVYLPLVLKNYAPLAPGAKYAVVVGIADFQYINDLDYTDDDAYDFRNALLTYGGFDSANINLLIDSQATKAAIQDAINNWLDSREGTNDLVILFYSAHGGPGPDVAPVDETDGQDEYLCAYDSLPTSYANDIRDDELDTWLSQLESENVVVIVDTCHSGGLIGTAVRPDGQIRCIPPKVPLPPMTAEMRPDGFARDVSKLNRIVMAASAETESSWEYSALQNGVFTYYLVEGLQSPSADANSNNYISAEESYTYLYGPVVSHTSNDQHPQISDQIAGEVDLTQP